MLHQTISTPAYEPSAAFEERLPIGHKGHALLLNNTATSYHWGCYGTSMAIYETLINSGYSVATVDVETTNLGLGYPPSTANNQTTIEFAEQMQVVNASVFRAIRDADLIVVNGEGTLHRFHRASRTLLSAIRMAKMMGKRVHLINHACFPSGGLEASTPDVEQFYFDCLRDVDRIVVRDDWSSRIYERLGIKHEMGFDCLPLYIKKYVTPQPTPRSIIIGGASHWTPEITMHIGQMLFSILGQSNLPFVFLAGGFKREPVDDAVQFAAFSKVIPNIQLVRPKSLSEWVNWMASAELTITGRFHHFIAAATISAPIVMMPGNTAKSNAIAAMLGAPAPIVPTGGDARTALAERISKPFVSSAAQVQSMLERALVNFDF